MGYVGVTQPESGENRFYPSTFVMRLGPILNVLFDLSQLSSLSSQGVPLPMPPVVSFGGLAVYLASFSALSLQCRGHLTAAI